MTQQELISRYQDRLDKVKAQYHGDCRKENYIEFAEKELEAVKAGRDW